MIIDNVDIKIINILYNLGKNEEINTKFDMVRKIFPNSDKYELRKNYTRIKRKLRKLVDYGVIKLISDEDKVNYQLQSKNIDFKRFKFKDGFRRVICMKVEGEWIAVEMNNSL